MDIGHTKLLVRFLIRFPFVWIYINYMFFTYFLCSNCFLFVRIETVCIALDGCRIVSMACAMEYNTDSIKEKCTRQHAIENKAFDRFVFVCTSACTGNLNNRNEPENDVWARSIRTVRNQTLFTNSLRFECVSV